MTFVLNVLPAAVISVSMNKISDDRTISELFVLLLLYHYFTNLIPLSFQPSAKTNQVSHHIFIFNPLPHINVNLQFMFTSCCRILSAVPVCRMREGLQVEGDVVSAFSHGVWSRTAHSLSAMRVPHVPALALAAPHARQA